MSPWATTSWPMPSPGITARLMLRDMTAPYSSSHGMTWGVRDTDSVTGGADGPTGDGTFVARVHPYVWRVLVFAGNFQHDRPPGTPPDPLPDFGIPPQLARRMSMAEQHEYLRTKLTRRRTLVTAGALAAGGLLTGCGGSASPGRPHATASAPAPATAEVPGSAVAPFGRHLAFGADPKTQMRISWQVPLAVKKPYVRVGPEARGAEPEDRGRGPRPAHAGRRRACAWRWTSTTCTRPWTACAPARRTTTASATRASTRPSPAHRSTIGTFRTAPAPPEKFVFTAFGDQGVSKTRCANDKLILRPEARLPSARGRHLLRGRQRPGRGVGQLRPAGLGPVPQADRDGGQVACRGW